MKKHILLILTATSLGAVLFGWFSPDLITWYYTPPAELAFNCEPAVKWSMDIYRKFLITGASIGFVLGTILAIKLGTRPPPPIAKA